MSVSDLTPGQEFGQYVITRLLGRGGMGAVWLARQPSLNRDVALKVMAPQLAHDPQFVARFRREAETAAGLSHPHIVSVFDIGEVAGALYISMEYVPGESLSDLLAREGRVAPEVAAQWGCELAGALAYAHDRGVLHRDVKPGNVLVGERGHARLMDFGLAKSMEATALTQTGLLGTPYYMAPELGQGQAASPLTDQYALGIVLYESLTGRRPFSGESPVSILYQHAHATAPPIGELRPETPDALQRVVHRMMAREPRNRFPGCAEAAAELDVVRAQHRVSSGVFAIAHAGSRAAASAGRVAAADAPTVTSVPPRGGQVIEPAPAPTEPADRAERPKYAIYTIAVVVLAVVALAVAFRSGPKAAEAPAAAGPPGATEGPPAEPGPAAAPPGDRPAAPAGPAETLGWKVAQAPTRLPNGGFVESFTGATVALRPRLERGTPRVVHADGRLTVHGTPDTIWRASALEPVAAEIIELLVTVEPGAEGDAGLFARGVRAGGIEVLVSGRGTIELVRRQRDGTEIERVQRPLPANRLGPVRLRVISRARATAVFADDEEVYLAARPLPQVLMVGLAAYGPVTAHFEQLVVRPAAPATP